MSYDNALKIISHQKSSAPSQWEWIANPQWIESRQKDGESSIDTMRRLYDEYDWDFGGAAAVSGLGTGTALPPIREISLNEIYDFDPEHPPEGQLLDYTVTMGAEPSLPAERMAGIFAAKWQASQDMMFQRSMVPGAHYHQVLHYCTTTFGWEKTMLAAYENPTRFEELLDRLTALTIKVNEAWAMTGVRLMICHDDIAMVDRLLFPPAWYRQVILPRYEKCWTPLKKKNISILFMSDGKIDDIAADLADSGADGLFVDDVCDIGRITRQVGARCFLMGNIKLSALHTGDRGMILAEIRRLKIETAGCENLVVRCSAGIDENVPFGIVQFYMDEIKKIRSGQGAFL
jgi:hypothetical protein